MTTYQILISDREYKSWSFVEPETQKPKLPLESEQLFNPIHLKLFHEDLIDLSTPIPTIVHSPVRTSQIAGVLILEGNQTYGRTDNQKRLFYKCIPNNPRFPAFLIPYAPDVKFAKTQKNRYVIFRFDNWLSKHPQGILTENLGEVGVLSVFYEYQLYCRNIHANISELNAATKRALRTAPDAIEQINQNAAFFKNYVISDNVRVFSIDPAGATDFDDAFSIIQNSPFLATVRIYIANVFVWLETLKLWDYVGNRASTIYLPDFKRPMLPVVLSEHSCSLVADKQERVAFCMELQINVEKSAIIPDSARFYNQKIRIDKNYAYESVELLKDPDYCLLRRFSKLIDSNVHDSRDVVAFWMIQMNAICAEKLYKRGTGIFRQTIWNSDETRTSSYAEGTLGAHACNIVKPRTHSLENLAPILRSGIVQKHLPDRLHPSTRRIISNWKHATGAYMDFNSVQLSPDNDLYVHITSPIRRIIDLLNQIIFQVEMGMISSISREATAFVEKWTKELPAMNVKLRSIRKVQIDCDMLQRCSAHPEWMQQLHQGVIFDRVFKPDGMYSYMVHLPELNILGRISSPEKYVNYQSLQFNLFVFEDADKLQRKIRLGISNVA